MPSYRTKQILQIAKIIRNADIALKDKALLTKNFNELFFEDNPTFDTKRFVAICNSTLTDDQLWRYNRMKSCGDLNEDL